MTEYERLKEEIIATAAGYTDDIKALTTRLMTIIAKRCWFKPKNFPKIVCLCGSTRFMDTFFDQGFIETLAGNIVLSVGVYIHAQTADGGHVGEMLGQGVCEKLDELHLRKIDLADEVLILNVGGYIGDSTRHELDYAQAKGKVIRFLEPVVEIKKEE